MAVDPPPVGFRSRRAFLAFAAGAFSFGQETAGRGETLPSEATRYFDAATEFAVVRLTDPRHTSLLTAPQNRSMGRHNFLLFSSDWTGKFDVYRVDLRNGQRRRLTDGSSVDPASVALLPGERSFCYTDGVSVREVEIATKLREHELYSAPPPFERLHGLALSPSEASAFVIESKPGLNRIRLVTLNHGPAVTILETDRPVGALFPRPGGGLAYRGGDGVGFIEPGGHQRTLPLAPDQAGPMYWSPDGASLLYLNIPGRPGELNSIRECVLSTGEDRLISKTTQFVEFYPNADASVFVGASGSKASPHVLILLRTSHRELTLCEHRAQDSRSLAVVFSQNSQRVVFQSDRDGKPSLYTMSVERFVAETST